MPKFELEERYVVFKLSRIKTDADMAAIDTLRDILPGATVDCIVIEQKWPIYDKVLDLLKEHVESQPEQGDGAEN